MEGKQLFLKQQQAIFLGMAVAAMLEDMEVSLQNPNLNWTPEARKIQKEIYTAGIELRTKLLKIGIPCEPLDPFVDGDEEEFLTKES